MAVEEAMLCLASEQPMANAIAMRQVGCERVLILHTDDEDKSAAPARRLQEWWKAQGGKAICRRLEHAADFPQVHAEIVARLNELNVRSWLANVTGGTKLLSLAAISVSLDRKARICCVDTPRNRLIWLNDSSVEPLVVEFGIDEVIQLHGFEVRGRGPVDENRFRAARALARHRDLTALVAGSCQNQGFVAPFIVGVAASQVAGRVVQELTALGVLVQGAQSGDPWRLELTRDGYELFRKDWLELIAAEAFQLAGAREVATNLTVPYNFEPGKEKSESDALGVVGCRLLVAECKATSGLYREEIAGLASRARTLGGSMALGVLVWSPSKPPHMKATVQRGEEQANDLGVHLYCGHDPAELAERIHDWLEPA